MENQKPTAEEWQSMMDAIKKEIGVAVEIKARFDTEKELRENIINYPGMRMQKITSSHRKDLY